MCCHKEKRGGTRCPKKIVNGSVGNPCSFCLTVQSSAHFLTYSVNGLFLMLKFQDSTWIHHLTEYCQKGHIKIVICPPKGGQQNQFLHVD